MVQRENSFTTLSVAKSLILPLLQVQQLKDQVAELQAVGPGCVNPTQSKASLQFFCCVEMVGQEQRTAPDAAEQTEETEKLRAAEAQAQQQAGRLVSSWNWLMYIDAKVMVSHSLWVFFL